MLIGCQVRSGQYKNRVLHVLGLSARPGYVVASLPTDTGAQRVEIHWALCAPIAA